MIQADTKAASRIRHHAMSCYAGASLNLFLYCGRTAKRQKTKDKRQGDLAASKCIKREERAGAFKDHTLLQ